MLNLEVVFTFPVLDDLSGNLIQKLKIVKFKLKFSTQTYINIQNSIAIFTFCVFDQKYPFWANLV